MSRFTQDAETIGRGASELREIAARGDEAQEAGSIPDQHTSHSFISRLIVVSLVSAVGLLAGCARVSNRQSAVHPASPQAELLANLWWAMLIGSIVILAIVTVLMLIGVFRARGSQAGRPLSRVQSRNLVLAGGVIIPLVVLIALLIGSVSVDRAASAVPRDALTVEVVGHRWWWEVHYLDERQRRIATTANEIHVPVGRPVRFLLKTVDVIHSFWVPNLQGKTDLIPGQTNQMLLTARVPGEYRGQCAEFCGMQHAKMGLLIVAQPQEQFAQWLARQGQPAVEPVNDRLRRGQQVFLSGPCVMCHAIRGTIAQGRVAPDLTHLASRRTLAAAEVPNNRGYLAGWIIDSQNIKPGNLMPPITLAPDDLHALLDYLQSLE